MAARIGCRPLRRGSKNWWISRANGHLQANVAALVLKWYHSVVNEALIVLDASLLLLKDDIAVLLAV